MERKMKRRVRFFNPDFGTIGWTRWFDIEGDDIESACEPLHNMKVERVEVVEEMTREEFEMQYLVT
jgi:hypothetical protein